VSSFLFVFLLHIERSHCKSLIREHRNLDVRIWGSVPVATRGTDGGYKINWMQIVVDESVADKELWTCTGCK
jgi:hypothetical protein